MRLRCPNCREVIDRHNINIEKTIAVCDACGEVFNFEGMIRGRKRKEREQPEGLRVLEIEDGVMIEISLLPTSRMLRTLIAMSYMLIIVAAVVFSFSLIVRARLNPLAVILSLLPTLPLIYFALAGLFNRLRVTLNNTTLRVQQSPLPVLTGRRLDRDHVVRFMSPANVGEGAFQHDVEARLRDGSRAILVRNLSEDNATYLKDILNTYLDEDDLDEPTAALRDEELPHLRRLQ
jgi:hypothetical protein